MKIENIHKLMDQRSKIIDDVIKLSNKDLDSEELIKLNELNIEYQNLTSKIDVLTYKNEVIQEYDKQEQESLSKGSILDKYNSKRKKINIKTLDVAHNLTIILSNVSSNYVESISNNNQLISNKIDELNVYINNIETPAQVNTAINTKNSIVNIINNNVSKYDNITNILNIINTILISIQVLITVLSNIPLPVPLAVTSKLELIKKIIIALLVFINAFLIIENLMEELELEKQRINNIDNILNSNINNFNIDELSVFTNNLNNNLNLTETYKGFLFKIIDEENGPVVKNIKRKLAIAVDSNNNIYLKSSPSFTNEPEQLIDELKLIIDKENLKI